MRHLGALAKRRDHCGIGTKFLADLDDGIGRDTQPLGRGTDRLGIWGLVEAIGLPLISAQKREQPLDADLVVDLFNDGLRFRIGLHDLGKIPLDQKQRHDSLPRPATFERASDEKPPEASPQANFDADRDIVGQSARRRERAVPTMTGTRRLAAILAADVAGYSRLMGIDEEGTLAALKAIRRELGDPKFEEHRGRIVKTTGDGLLVEFASVVDAVRCAVELQQGMAGRNAAVPTEKRIEFRIGINLGDVILDEGDIYGDGVNIAARLEALAEPGEICVSRVVRDQVRDKLDISFEDGGEQRVKNIARPVHVYRIPIAGHVAPAARQNGDSGFGVRRPETFIPAPTDRFVGRQRELEVLRDAFEQACAGHGRIVMLAGEPGIGKTRTAQELTVHAARREAAVLWGRCHEESGAPPYWPWVQVIRASLRDADPDLLAGFGAAASDIADIVPEIRDLLPGLERPAPLGDPSEARFRMFESIRQLLASLCRRRTLLIVLDDVHWADAPSLRLLEFLAPELGDSRLLLVGTYRATELSRQHPLSKPWAPWRGCRILRGSISPG
jgi:class 3 adenylate cyclase